MEKVGSQSHQETLLKRIQEPKLRDVLQNNRPMLLKNVKVIKDKMEDFQMKDIWQLNAMPDPELDAGPEEKKMFFFCYKGH